MIVNRWLAPVTPTVEQATKIFKSEGYRPYLEKFAGNSQVKEHRHPFDEIRMVVEGELTLNISGNQLMLRQGDRITIPANTRHWTQVNSDEPCSCICAQRAF